MPTATAATITFQIECTPRYRYWIAALYFLTRAKLGTTRAAAYCARHAVRATVVPPRPELTPERIMQIQREWEAADRAEVAR